MRLLLASDNLENPGGSETYLLTLGAHLQRLGHDVFVVPGPGHRASLAQHRGLQILTGPGELDVPPDRAIVQDAVVSGEVAGAWPTVPQLFVSHSAIHDLQLPGAVPSAVAAVVALNDRVADRVRASAGDIPVHRLTQPVDVGHFTLGPPPAPRPRRLLLFGNNKATWRSAALEAECAERGIEVQRIGAAAGNMIVDPVRELRAADIVVGYGRCILEAMACGRTAFVFDRFGSDGWLDADSYASLESVGFNGSAGRDVPGRDEWRDALDRYDPATGAVGHDLAYRHHDARKHTEAILDLLDGLGPVEAGDPHAAFVLGRIWREQWRWERQALTWAAEVDELRTQHRAREQELEDSLAAARAAHEQHRAELEAEIDSLRAEVHQVHQNWEEHLASRRYRVADTVMRVASWRPRRR